MIISNNEFTIERVLTRILAEFHFELSKLSLQINQLGLLGVDLVVLLVDCCFLCHQVLTAGPRVFAAWSSGRVASAQSIQISYLLLYTQLFLLEFGTGGY